MAEPTAEIWTFPTDPAEFEKDERISFSKLDNKYIAVQEDGTELEFDAQLKRWVPLADEEDEALIEEQQRGYFAPDDSDAQSSISQGKKRKQDASSNGYEDQNGRDPKSKRQATRANRAPPPPKQNTAVYVTGLPLDATLEEVAGLFSRKCGVIAEEIDSGRPRIKMYTDEAGSFKGDALIVFFKPQSVDMAIMLLDDTDFRFTPAGTSAGRMRVQAADTSYKKVQYDKAAAEGDAAPQEGGGNGAASKKPPPARNDQEKQKVIKKTQKLNAKLADWSDDEPSYLPSETKSSRWDKVVILFHMFTLQELEEDPAALLEIKEDIREECEKLGEVTNVVLFDKEEEGVVSVKFKTSESARACVQVMHGRSFGGQKVEAYVATGRERFRKSKNKDNDEDSDSDGQ
ncbi:Splicing factor U2AF-associated protein 2 [Pleurostoma richardsiae]|uniref:Splicing factor U2AF-associated protein 2 n=1 Tax=Pleurostoma richardsiae TaxID=41990 RepID=A0AA38RW50_9PEZI|nr:Splicing factor U2AF-associated protein 2 [Pleurostoma richardsiae]